MNRLGPALAALGVKNPFLVTGPGLVRAGLAERVYEAIGGEIPTYDRVQPEPGYELVRECVAMVQEHGADAVIGLGGGSAMDVAKMAASMFAHADQLDRPHGAVAIRQRGLPCIAIPTTAGTGAEVSPAVVFGDPDTQHKTGIRSAHLIPSAVILDAALTVSMPQAITASTGMDALTHAIEGYTALAATRIGDMAAERSIAMIAEYLPVAYAQGGDLAARDGQLMASYFAGLTLSVAGVGIVHALAHCLGALYHVPHGVANALFLPHCMAFNRPACRAKYATVAELLGQPTDGLSLDDAATEAIEAVFALNKALGIPERLRDLDVPRKGLCALVANVFDTQARIITNNPRSVSHDECLALAEAAW